LSSTTATRRPARITNWEWSRKSSGNGRKRRRTTAKPCGFYVEFNDRYEQASIYHQLGRVAEEQGQWAETEKNYREALRIFREFKDPHNLQITLGSLARIGPESLGLAGRVAEILGVTPDQAQELLDRSGPKDAASD
jgi:hypothetical protein